MRTGLVHAQKGVLRASTARLLVLVGIGVLSAPDMQTDASQTGRPSTVSGFGYGRGPCGYALRFTCLISGFEPGIEFEHLQDVLPPPPAPAPGLPLSSSPRQTPARLMSAPIHLCVEYVSCFFDFRVSLCTL